MEKIGQNPKIGKLWRPAAPQTYVVCTSYRKVGRTSETPWLLDYYVESTVSLCSASREICSLLWVRCLFGRLSISDFGGKWPLKWKFSKTSFRIYRRDTKIRFVAKVGENRPLRSCRKVAWITTQKTWALRDSSRPPFCPKWVERAQNSLNVVTPRPVHVYRIWSGSAAFCRTYSGKIDFFGSKSQYNKKGFQPTITQIACLLKLRLRQTSHGALQTVSCCY